MALLASSLTLFHSFCKCMELQRSYTFQCKEIKDTFSGVHLICSKELETDEKGCKANPIS